MDTAFFFPLVPASISNKTRCANFLIKMCSNLFHFPTRFFYTELVVRISTFSLVNVMFIFWCDFVMLHEAVNLKESLNFISATKIVEHSSRSKEYKKD